jgi:hypothetical protein
MKSARTAPPGDNRATWATAFEAAPLTKPPALRGVSDLSGSDGVSRVSGESPWRLAQGASPGCGAVRSEKRRQARQGSFSAIFCRP